MKIVYALTEDPKSFVYIPPERNVGGSLNPVVLLVALGLLVGYLANLAAGGESTLRDWLLFALLVILAFQILGFMLRIHYAQKIAQLFSAWAIEHHGLVPQEYRCGSYGKQEFISVETGEKVVPKYPQE